MRRRLPLLLTTGLVLAACSASGTSAPPGPTTGSAPLVVTPSAPGATVTDDTGPAATVDSPVPAPHGVVALADGVVRIGDGRALFATYDPAADRTVIATTIGLVALTGDGPATTISPVRAVRFAVSSDGSRVAAISSAGSLGIWDVTTGTSLRSFDVTVDDTTTLTFAGADTVLVADAATVTRYGTDGTTAAVVTAPADGPLGPAVVDDAGTLAVAVQSPVPSVATWSAQAGPGTIDLGLASGARLTGVAWAPDGGHLAVLDAPPSAGDQLELWDVAAARFVGAPVALPNFVTPGQVAFPTPDRVVLPVLDQIAAYDLHGAQVASSPTGESAVGAIQTSGGAAIVSRLDGTVSRWTITGPPSDLGPRTVALVDQRGGSAVTTVDQRGLVRTYGADGGARHQLDHWAVGQATSVDLSADGARIAVATSNGAVRLLDATTGEPVEVLDRPQGDVSDVAFAPDDTVVATGVSVQKRAEAWDDTIEATALTSDASLFKLGGRSEDVNGCSFYEGHVVFSPDGTLLASSSHDFTVQVTPLADPAATTVLEPHRGTVYDVRFSPDGRHLVTSSDDGSMRVWQVDGWKLLGEYRSLTGGYVSLAFSPDGSKLAVSGATGEISLVDPATGAAVTTFAGTRAVLGGMTFTPDGRLLLAPLVDGSVGIWAVDSGQMVHQLVGHTMPVTGIVVSKDGSRVVTSSQDGTVRSWPLPAA
jgi:WD40 repeat protein